MRLFQSASLRCAQANSLLNAGVGHDFFRVNKSTSLLIEWHFAELYDDARERSRTLITGLRDAAFVGLVYKS